MIDNNIYIEDMVREYPEVISLLAEYGLVCIACGEPVWGTLKELVDKKGLNNLDEIIGQLNSIIKDKSDKNE